MENKKVLHERFRKIYRDISNILENEGIEYQKLDRLIDAYLDFDGISFFAQYVVENPVFQFARWSTHLPQEVSSIFCNCFEIVARSRDLNTVRYAYEAVHQPRMKDFEEQSKLGAYTEDEIQKLEDILTQRQTILKVIKGEDMLRREGWKAIYEDDKFATEDVIAALDLHKKEYEMNYNLILRAVEAFNQSPHTKKPITAYALFGYLENQLMDSRHYKETWLIYPEDRAWIEQQNPRDYLRIRTALMKKHKEGEYGGKPNRTHVPDSENQVAEDMYYVRNILRLIRAYRTYENEGNQADWSN